MATTGQLINPKTFDWDYELIDMLGYNREIFQKVHMPGTSVGHFKEEIQKEVGFDCEVVLCGSHDTASAVLAVPANDDDFLYISSGTWSLMGIEKKEADCSDASQKANLTNEGGYDKRYRYLKNIMGLWMIQSVRHEYKDAYSFAQLCDMAEESKNFPSRVDVNDPSFLSPDSMVEAIKQYCQKTGQPVPESVGELASVVYRSLAQSYGETVSGLEKIAGRTYDSIHIIGGGSNAAYLNQLTADATGKTVYAGPGEATAIGNLLAQMIHAEELADLKSARKCVQESFEIRTFDPEK